MTDRDGLSEAEACAPSLVSARTAASDEHIAPPHPLMTLLLPLPERRPSGRAARSGRRLLALAGTTVAALVLVPVAAIGQTSPTDAQRRDEVRRQKADVAAGIDALRATDEELEASVRTLAENLKAQQARAHDANLAAEEARAHVDALNAELDRTQAEVDALQEQVRLRAIEAYVNPNGQLDNAEQALRTDDLTSAERKAELLNSATGHDNDAQDKLRAAQARLESKRADAAAAQVEAQLREAEADAQVQQVQVAKEEKDRLKAALDQRIADLHAEMAGLTAEEDQITALIASAQAAQAAQAAQSAQAAAPSGGIATAAAPGADGTPATTGGGAPTSSAGGASSPSTGAPVTTSAPVPTGNVGQLSWPTSGSVSSGFGSRWGAFHSGIDIATPAGTPITAAAPGVVISAGYNGGGYGNLVLVDHGGGMVTAYAHQSSIVASAGQSVGRGQLLGYVGCTGSCTGDHLHFEVRVNGSAQDPMAYL